MNHLISLAILLLMPVSQNQNLPDAYYQLPEQVREQATIIATGTYALGRSPYILMPDGTQVWARTSWFRITKVHRGQVAGRSIHMNISMLPKTKYVSAKLEVGREYLLLLRPGSKSLKVLKAGEQIPVRDALRDEEIIAIIPAQTTEASNVSNPALRADLLNRDEANVDKRRVEVGLPPLAEDLEKQVRNRAPQETTLKVANRDLIITLHDAERIKLTVEKYLAKTRPKLKPSVPGPDEVFIDGRGTVRMGAWILESSLFSAEPELRLTVRIHNSEYLIVRREIRVQQTEGQWKVVADGRVTYHRERK